MARARCSLPLATALLVAAVLLAGCGSGASQSHTRTQQATKLSPRPRPPGFGSPRIPTPPPTGTTPNSDAVKVIKAWSSALARGDVRTAAGYFSVPSELLNGGNGTGIELTIHTLAQAVAANETLPCGAKFVSADQRGRYTNALFKLTGRPGPGGSSCGGGGSTARTNFLIEQGKIVEWIRAPDDPGDNGGPPSPPGPSSPPGATNTV